MEEHETFDYTIWRAANAILDLRLEAMKLEIKSRLDQGEELNSIRYLGPGCYVEWMTEWLNEYMIDWYVTLTLICL